MHNFKPLNHVSQGTSHDLLFVDTSAPAEEIWESVFSRISAVSRLNDELAITANDKLDHTPLALVNSILLSDAMSIFGALYPHARDSEAKATTIELLTKTAAELSEKLAAITGEGDANE